MAWIGRKRRARSSEPSASEAQKATMQHFGEFVSTRTGVEAFIEPPTHVTQTTMVLIAASGEWTRRRVPNAASARQVAQRLKVPVYDVNLTGYPPRMREWNAAQRGRRREG